MNLCKAEFTSLSCCRYQIFGLTDISFLNCSFSNSLTLSNLTNQILSILQKLRGKKYTWVSNFKFSLFICPSQVLFHTFSKLKHVWLNFSCICIPFLYFFQMRCSINDSENMWGRSIVFHFKNIAPLFHTSGMH